MNFIRIFQKIDCFESHTFCSKLYWRPKIHQITTSTKLHICRPRIEKYHQPRGIWGVFWSVKIPHICLKFVKIPTHMWDFSNTTSGHATCWVTWGGDSPLLINIYSAFKSVVQVSLSDIFWEFFVFYDWCKLNLCL